MPEYPPLLTDREHDVMEIICKGATTDEAADTLLMASSTVAHHIHNILRKFGCKTRLQAIRIWESPLSAL